MSGNGVDQFQRKADEKSGLNKAAASISNLTENQVIARFGRGVLQRDMTPASSHLSRLPISPGCL